MPAIKQIKEHPVEKILYHLNQYISNRTKTNQTTTLFKRVVVFGDELCDMGRFYTPTKGYFPPSNFGFYKGRWTNGKLWIELLCESLGLSLSSINNYAIAGATSGLLNPYSSLRDVLKLTKSIRIDGMLNQVNRYIESKPKITNEVLFVLSAGYNDLPYYINIGKPQLAKGAIVGNNISTAVTLLSEIGGSEFLICNLAKLTETPCFDSPKIHNYIKSFCSENNLAIQNVVQEHTDSEIHIKLLDVHSLFQNVFEYPEHFGFSYHDAFLPVDVVNFEAPYEEQEIRFLHQESGLLADQFVYWWRYWPGAPMHRIIAKEAEKLFIQTDT